MKTALASMSVVMALASGCASTARAPEEPAYKGPNPGAEVAKGCGAGAIGSLKAGLIGVPIGATILVVCMPIAAAAAVIHEVVPVRGYAGGADSGEFAYPDGSPALRTGAYVNGGRGSSYGTYPDGHLCFRRCW
jgi:hypothetical protein